MNYQDEIKQVSKNATTLRQPQTPRSNKNLLILGLISIIVIALSGIGGYILIRGDKKTQQGVREKNTSPTIGVSETTIWPSLSSEQCKLTLTYPPEWNADLKGEQVSCIFTIEDPANNNNSFILAGVLDTTWSEILSQNPEGQPIIVAGVEGVKLNIPDEGVPIPLNGLYFHKGNSIFNIVYFSKPGDSDTDTKISQIISSIKLTGTLSDYEKGFTSGVDKAINQAKDKIIKSDLLEIKSPNQI
jgi:uncharacterized protein (UPF0333 family)